MPASKTEFTRDVSIFIGKKKDLKAEFHGQAHARADRLKNKLYGSTLNSKRACGGTIC